MYIEEVEKILDELGGYLKIVGVKTGVRTIPYRLHGDYFIQIANANKCQLKQAASLMSNDHHAFHLALAQRLEHFAGEMGGEYAERATDIIAALAKLNEPHASKQHEEEVAGPKSAAAKVHSRLKVLKIFNRISSNPNNFGGWRGL